MCRKLKLVLVMSAVVCASRASGQVWVDVGDLHGQRPGWVEEKYWEGQRVGPVYRVVCERVWHEAVVKSVCEMVWVPAKFGWREVVTYDACGCPIVRREWVCISPGHFETVRREVLVRPGWWETVERRELVAEGNYEVVAKTVGAGGGYTSGW
jgi:hypothetical protein